MSKAGRILALTVLVVTSIAVPPYRTAQAGKPASPFAELKSRESGSASLDAFPPESATRLIAGEEWRTGLYGTVIGGSNIAVFDIDNDGHLEMVMGGFSPSGSGDDDFWYILRQTGPDTYAQVWWSDRYSTSIARIDAADVDGDQIGEIFVGLSDGEIQVFDGTSRKQTSSLKVADSLSTFRLADVDGDGSTEILFSDGVKIYVYSAVTFTQKWISTAYGSESLAVGNVDNDPAPEIISAGGNVIDGITHSVEWQYPATGGFGALVEAADVDDDGIAEIVGAASWDKVTIFDADIKTPSWEIITSQDVKALLVADMEGDGIPDILYGDGQWGYIHCYDGKTHLEKWKISNPRHGVTGIAIGDMNEDGTMEVMWGAGATSTGPDYLYVADPVSKSIEWQSLPIDGPLYAADTGDVDDDGAVEIVMASYESQDRSADGVIQIFDGATHALEWQQTDQPGIQARSGVRSVLIGDVDDDGRTEFVIATAHIFNGLLQIYDGQTHALERQSPLYTGTIFTCLALGDVDSDGHSEIIAGQELVTTVTTGVHLIAFDGATAVEEWKSVSLDTDWGPVYDIELDEVNTDGHVEIVASVAGQRIYVYDGSTHQLDWFASLAAYALKVADTDADGTQEILIGEAGGVVEVYQGTDFAFERSFSFTSGTITGLLEVDLDNNGTPEWLLSNSSRLAIAQRSSNVVTWQSAVLGGFGEGFLNQLHAQDVDGDSVQEIVAGSDFALYQFEVAVAPPTFDVFLPLVVRPPTFSGGGLTGHVTSNGANAAGVRLDLRFYNGATWSVAASTTTNAEGNYSFTSVASLSPGQAYCVRYLNTAENSNGRLGMWTTREITSYTYGENVLIGNFDLMDTPLISPTQGASVGFPVTFVWQKRLSYFGDDYQLELFDLAGPSDFLSPYLGYEDNYNLNGLPAGFPLSANYGWAVWVSLADGAYGVSFYYNPITFLNSGSVLPASTAAVERVNLRDIRDILDRHPAP